MTHQRSLELHSHLSPFESDSYFKCVDLAEKHKNKTSSHDDNTLRPRGTVWSRFMIDAYKNERNIRLFFSSLEWEWFLNYHCICRAPCKSAPTQFYADNLGFICPCIFFGLCSERSWPVKVNWLFGSHLRSLLQIGSESVSAGDKGKIGALMNFDATAELSCDLSNSSEYAHVSLYSMALLYISHFGPVWTLQLINIWFQNDIRWCMVPLPHANEIFREMNCPRCGLNCSCSRFAYLYCRLLIIFEDKRKGNVFVIVHTIHRFFTIPYH